MPCRSRSRRRATPRVIFGIHVAKLPLAFHLTLHRYFDDEDYAAATGGELNWVKVSFERRF